MYTGSISVIPIEVYVLFILCYDMTFFFQVLSNSKNVVTNLIKWVHSLTHTLTLTLTHSHSLTHACSDKKHNRCDTQSTHYTYMYNVCIYITTCMTVHPVI